MRIIRLLGPDGHGVFWSKVNDGHWITSVLGTAEPELYELASSHPSPWQDPAIGAALYYSGFPSECWRFGFASVEQMLDWFPRKALRLMRRHGMRVKVYDVPHKFCATSRYQAVFVFHEAREVEKKRGRLCE